LQHVCKVQKETKLLASKRQVILRLNLVGLNVWYVC